jgi:hypothetical protein
MSSEASARTNLDPSRALETVRPTRLNWAPWWRRPLRGRGSLEVLRGWHNDTAEDRPEEILLPIKVEGRQPVRDPGATRDIAEAGGRISPCGGFLRRQHPGSALHGRLDRRGASQSLRNARWRSAVFPSFALVRRIWPRAPARCNSWATSDGGISAKASRTKRSSVSRSASSTSRFTAPSFARSDSATSRRLRPSSRGGPPARARAKPPATSVPGLKPLARAALEPLCGPRVDNSVTRGGLSGDTGGHWRTCAVGSSKHFSTKRVIDLITSIKAFGRARWIRGSPRPRRSM